MTYALHEKRPVIVGVRRIASAQLDQALSYLDDLPDRPGDGKPLHHAVHEVRKCLKRVRGLVRLVRPALGDTYHRENKALRDAGRLLSDLRDTAAMVEAIDLLAEEYSALPDESLAPVREGLVARRRESAGDPEIPARLQHARQAIAESRGRVEDWTLDAEGFDAVSGGLEKTYRRAVDRMADARADPTVAHLHVWRKRAKYHRYHMALLRPVFPDVIGARREAAHDLTDHLGDHHDLDELEPILEGDPDAFGGQDVVELALALADRLRGRLRADAFAVGERLLVDDPGDLVDRVRAWWNAPNPEG